MSATTSAGNDHPLRQEVNEQVSNVFADSSPVKQHGMKQNGNEAVSLLVENDRLRGELIELRRLLSQMEHHHHRLNHQIPIPPKSTSPGTKKKNGNASVSHSSRKQDGSNMNPNNAAVVLEMPVTLDNGTGNSKDHQSVSTADDRETVEPTIDIESHQSAKGLHHRSSHATSISTTNIPATPTSTRPTRSTRISALMIDDEYSSGSMDGFEDDDAMAESQGLIASNQKTDGIMRKHRGEAYTVADGSDANQPNQHRQMTFLQSLADRAGWLIGLLILQSLSSFILAKNELLLQNHTVIVQFLTMLVGAGGNAGNQASVGVVRGIAIGTVNRSNAKRVLLREFSMGVALSIILGLAGFFRAKIFAVSWMETIAITTSLFLIVIISVIVGAALPMGMEAVGIDPAHSSTTIQVIMDITGVIITVHVSSFMLDSEFHDWLATKLSFDGEMR